MMKKVYWVLAGLGLVNVVWNGTLYFSSSRQSTANYLFNVVYVAPLILAIVVAVWGVKIRGLGSTLSKSLVCLAIGFCFYVLAQVGWAYYSVVLQVEAPYPGLSDIFFLLFYPFASIGFVLLVKDFGGKFNMRLIIEMAIVFGVMFAIMYSFLQQVNISESVPLVEQALNIAYPALDALLMALAITAIRTRLGSLHPNLLLNVFAYLFMAIADILFAYRAALDTYWNGDVSDTLYMVVCFLFAWGVINSVGRLMSQPALNVDNGNGQS